MGSVGGVCGIIMGLAAMAACGMSVALEAGAGTGALGRGSSTRWWVRLDQSFAALSGCVQRLP
jgi:hypothetical protein